MQPHFRPPGGEPPTLVSASVFLGWEVVSPLGHGQFWDHMVFPPLQGSFQSWLGPLESCYSSQSPQRHCLGVHPRVLPFAPRFEEPRRLKKAQEDIRLCRSRFWNAPAVRPDGADRAEEASTRVILFSLT